MSLAQRADGRWIVRYKDAKTGQWKQKAFRDKHPAQAFDQEAIEARYQKKRIA